MVHCWLGHVLRVGTTLCWLLRVRLRVGTALHWLDHMLRVGLRCMY